MKLNLLFVVFMMSAGTIASAQQTSSPLDALTDVRCTEKGAAAVPGGVACEYSLQLRDIEPVTNITRVCKGYTLSTDMQAPKAVLVLTIASGVGTKDVVYEGHAVQFSKTKASAYSTLDTVYTNPETQEQLKVDEYFGWDEEGQSMGVSSITAVVPGTGTIFWARNFTFKK